MKILGVILPLIIGVGLRSTDNFQNLIDTDKQTQTNKQTHAGKNGISFRR